MFWLLCYTIKVHQTILDNDITVESALCKLFFLIWFKVAEASDMTDYIADIMDCGYTGKIDMEHKENILR